MKIPKKSLATAAAVALLLGAAGCNTTLSQGAGNSTADSASKLASIDQSLQGNIYIQAAEQSGQGSNTCPATKPADQKLNLTFSIEGLTHPFLAEQVKLAQEAAASVNANMTIASGDDDVNKQLTGIENALNSKPDGLLLMPATTEGLQPILQSYTDQKIPYAFTAKGMTGITPVTQFLQPYGEEGKALGDYVVNYYKDQAGPIKVAVITGIDGDASSVARVGMFEKSLLTSGKFEIVAEQAGQYRRQPSQDAMDGILAAHPDVQLVFGANDDAALGALDSISSAGKKADIKVVGLDGEPDMFTAIESGDALATVVSAPNAGEATKLLASCIRGEAIPAFQVQVGDVIDEAAIKAGATPAW